MKMNLHNTSNNTVEKTFKLKGHVGYLAPEMILRIADSELVLIFLVQYTF